MIGINDFHVASVAHGSIDKCLNAWKLAVAKANELDCLTGDEEPLAKCEHGNLNLNSIIEWIRSVEIPSDKNSAEFRERQRQLNLLARFAATVEHKIPKEEE